jgi:hypothetical protein
MILGSVYLGGAYFLLRAATAPFLSFWVWWASRGRDVPAADDDVLSWLIAGGFTGVLAAIAAWYLCMRGRLSRPATSG